MKDTSDPSDNLTFLSIDEMVHNQDWLKNIDNLQISLEEKLNKVISAIECPTEIMNLFDVLIGEIEKRLCRSFRRRVNVFGFGSYFTGLALKNSDLDLVIELNTLKERDNILRQVRKFFYGTYFNDIFKTVIFIKAKVPILRCRHILGFQCDVSADNKLSRHNSELIKFYVSMEENYRTMFMIIKFWMKRMRLSDSQIFKNYATTLLVIFFLQQKQYIPSVEYIQKHPQNPGSRIIEGWDSSFLADNNLLLYNSPHISIIYLLRDFYQFYSTYEFGFYIISPFLGEQFLKPFDTHKNRFPQYEQNNGLFKDTSYICIQDVFKHDFNVTHLVTKEAVLDFQTYCKTAEELCSEVILKSCPFLETLFNPIKKLQGKRKRKNTPLILCAGKSVSGNSGVTENLIAKNWVSETLSAIESLFKKVVLVDEISREEGCLSCSISHWSLNKNLRAEAAKTLTENYSSPLDHEAAISAILLDSSECKLKTPYNFQLRYEVSFKPTRLTMKLNYNKNNCLEVEHLQILNKCLTKWLRLID